MSGYLARPMSGRRQETPQSPPVLPEIKVIDVSPEGPQGRESGPHQLTDGGKVPAHKVVRHRRSLKAAIDACLTASKLELDSIHQPD